MRKFLFIALLACLGYTSGRAQEKNDWFIRLRGLAVLPTESADIGVIGGDPSIGNAYIPELDISYFFAKNWSLELILGTSRHKVRTLASDLSAIGLGQADVDLGKVWLLPPTLTVQYHLPTGIPLKPYIGAGANYTIFYNSDAGNTVKGIDYDNAFSFAAQLGTDIFLTDKFFLNVDFKYLTLSTDVHVDASNLATSTDLSQALGNIGADVKIRPWLLGVGVGLKF